MVGESHVVVVRTEEELDKIKTRECNYKIKRSLLGKGPYHCKPNESVLVDGEGHIWIVRRN